MLRYLSLILTLALSLVLACDDMDTGPSGNFDRTQMLENLADNMIVPRLEILRQRTESLDVAIQAFSQDASIENLTAAQEAWKAAVATWQANSSFGFGPGDLTLGPMGSVLGTFPVDASAIEQAIDEQEFSLNNFRRDVRGFYAMEYLLFGPSPGQNNVLNPYQSAGGTDRIAYLTAVNKQLVDDVAQVAEEWTSSYRTTFIESDGTSAGSSSSLLFNAFSQDFEVLKNFKVGLPAGKRPGQVTAEPDKVEAYYSGMSRQLIEEHFAAIVEVWEGGDGPGFREYLESVEGGPALVEDTQAQIAQVEQAIGNLPDEPLTQLIAQDDPSVDSLHTELQKLTRFFKSDMSSLLGIAITFQSGDGD